VALPLAYLVMSRWLQAFAYHTAITASPFALAALVTVVIAWATVSVQAIKAAAANPVEALRYE
jgi:putative ABC transport system permease protein